MTTPTPLVREGVWIGPHGIRAEVRTTEGRWRILMYLTPGSAPDIIEYDSETHLAQALDGLRARGWRPSGAAPSGATSAAEATAQQWAPRNLLWPALLVLAAFVIIIVASR